MDGLRHLYSPLGRVHCALHRGNQVINTQSVISSFTYPHLGKLGDVKDISVKVFCLSFIFCLCKVGALRLEPSEFYTVERARQLFVGEKGCVLQERQ